MTATTSFTIFAELRRLIVLPDNVKSLELHLAVDTEATLTLVTGVALCGEPVTGILAPGDKTKRYYLAEILTPDEQFRQLVAAAVAAGLIPPQGELS